MAFREVKLGESLLLIGISFGAFWIALFLLSFFLGNPLPAAFGLWIVSMLLDTAAYSFYRKSFFLWPINALKIEGSKSPSLASAHHATHKVETRTKKVNVVRGGAKHESPESEPVKEKEAIDETQDKDKGEYNHDLLNTDKVEDSEEEEVPEAEDPEDEVDKYILNKNNHKTIIPVRDDTEDDFKENNYAFMDGSDSEEDK